MHRQPDTIWTVARIAEHLEVSRHRVEYIIESRAIRPRGTAGIARVFGSDEVDRIAAELDRIEASRKVVA